MGIDRPRTSNANFRVALSSVIPLPLATLPSDKVEIHISEAFQDIEPPHIWDNLMASSLIPS